MTAKALAPILALLVIGGAAATPLAARSGSPKSIVLGKTERYPDSGCPQTTSCEVVARVTGIQMTANNVTHPFRATKSGRLVSWWLRLPRLRKTQISTFNKLFGGEPKARIAVLRRGKRGRFRLIRQGPPQALQKHLGTRGRTRFPLPEPLGIRKGDYVGLTAVTWLPAFAVNLLPDTDAWLASRPRSRCNTPSSTNRDRFTRYYRRSQAHKRAGTVKRYKCLYRTARLLYWARMVPDAPTEEQPVS